MSSRLIRLGTTFLATSIVATLIGIAAHGVYAASDARYGKASGLARSSAKVSQIATARIHSDDPTDSESPSDEAADQTAGPAKKPEGAKTAKQPSSKKHDAQDKGMPGSIGEPLAPGMMKLLQDEIIAGIRRRGISDRFARFQSYAIGKVNSSAARFTGSELTGNCRLRWYDHMMRNFLTAPAEAERFTRELHMAAIDSRAGLAQALAIAAVKMDAGERKPRKLVKVESPEQALEIVKRALTEAQIAYSAALGPLTKQEIHELQESLVPVLCTQNQVGHTLNDRGTGRQLCDIMEKMDREAIHKAAEALAPLADVQVLEQLKGLKTLKTQAGSNVRVPGMTGTVVAKIDTPAGAIVIGGDGVNTYQLDQMRDVAAVIDLGGGNAYYEGTVGPDRPVLVVINLAGHNIFRGTQAGIQGGAVLGVSMVANLGGDNVYEAQDVAQGSALAGVGILIDFGPNNRYRGVRRVQGQAIGGVGILIGHGGKNDYHAAMWAQGFGGPLGFGMLENVTGNNHYYCGGMWRDSYPETPGYEGWGQGVGAGIRQVADGGIGVILDGGGENTYEFDYLSHGGGYWCGLGFARDFGGNTKRLITRTAYDGGQRTQPEYQRFGCGWGCHYAMGFMFDDSGDDVYEGTIMGTGMAWVCSMGVLCDFAGNDKYKSTGGLTQGTAHQMGFGILFDYNGDDVYEGYGQGLAATGISYHDMPSCGGNFAFLVDYGGKDKYGCEADNNCYIQRGDVGGFLIDRPRQDELQPTAKTAPPQQTASGS
ncbi:MAG: hypothetical protein LLG00_15655 [Planctomycetaceae bacterium]|nr:hypothetical protein [Planctomycetaceae bacterium]